MRTFAELLREYIERVGVSDAELARGLGVRRQTIFRWKEGLSERPRRREDVLRLAARLRLAPEERDALLLSAGFAPEETLPHRPAEAPHPAPPVAGAEARAADPAVAFSRTATGPLAAPAPRSDDHEGPEPQGSTGGLRPVEGAGEPAGNPRLQPDLAAGIPDSQSAPNAAPAGSLPARVRSRRLPVWTWAGAALIVIGAAAFAWLTWLRHPAYPVAQKGETLLLVAHFVNYGGGQQGYNVTGRLQAALEREIQVARLDRVRVAAWPAELRDEASAQATLRRANAALVIWGEYDSGRVLCHFTIAEPRVEVNQLEELLASPADLPATINSTLPEEVRQAALLTLGRLYVSRNDMAQARAVLAQALARPPEGRDAAGSLYFWLGYAYQSGPQPDLDRAIQFYSQALEAVANMTSARNNRGIALLRRGRADDMQQALDDLNQVLLVAPDDAAARNNRAVIYARRGRPGDLELALADLNVAVSLAPRSAEAYFNRGLIYLRQGDQQRWQADMQKALELDPSSPGALNSLCWGYALAGQADKALGYCDRAVAGDPAAASRDSRGVVYAELGRLTEAAADIRAFLDWAQGQADPTYLGYLDERRAWLDALEAGRNPIDETVLERLRQE